MWKIRNLGRVNLRMLDVRRVCLGADLGTNLGRGHIGRADSFGKRSEKFKPRSNKNTTAMAGGIA